MPNILIPGYYKLLLGIRNDVKEAAEEWKSYNTRDIVLIGRTGSGKSTLANVLTNSHDFMERSSERISQTHKTQHKTFTVSGIKYRVFDTIGFEDTYGTPEGVIIGNVLAAFCQAHIQGGVSQILFVNRGRFTPGEIKMYNLLSLIAFDSGLNDYITVVRTNFSDFNDSKMCEEDTKKMIDGGEELGNIIKNARERIIYVDNDHHNKESIKESRKRLLRRLEECNTTYQPVSIASSNEKPTQDLFKIMMWTKKKVESEIMGEEDKTIICEKEMIKPKETLFKEFQRRIKDYNAKVKDSDMTDLGGPADSEGWILVTITQLILGLFSDRSDRPNLTLLTLNNSLNLTDFYEKDLDEDGKEWLKTLFGAQSESTQIGDDSAATERIEKGEENETTKQKFVDLEENLNDLRIQEAKIEVPTKK